MADTEREAFEAWADKENSPMWVADLERHREGYVRVSTDMAWEAWKARAALASRPAEVDDEIAAFEKTLRQSQVPMDPEIGSVLGDNLWDLYESDDQSAPSHTTNKEK